MSKQKQAKTARAGRIESVLPALRAGRSVRRRAWHIQSKMISVDGSVFIMLPPAAFGKVPLKWAPYPEDLLATDWYVIPK